LDTINHILFSSKSNKKGFNVILALTLNAVKLVLQEMAAFHATGDHFITTYPGGLEALAHECPRVNHL